MEVKINREIREYTESIFFGLSMRQFIFSLIACGVAVLLYFSLRGKMGVETLSWICILGATPFGALGFIKYNQMNAEELLVAWIKSKVLGSKKFVFESKNIYQEIVNNSKKERKGKYEFNKKFNKNR